MVSSAGNVIRSGVECFRVRRWGLHIKLSVLKVVVASFVEDTCHRSQKEHIFVMLISDFHFCSY